MSEKEQQQQEQPQQEEEKTPQEQKAQKEEGEQNDKPQREDQPQKEEEGEQSESAEEATPQPQQQQQQQQVQSHDQNSFNLPPPPGPQTHPKNPPRSETARDQQLGPLRSHRQPLPNEMAELTKDEQPGGRNDEEEHSLKINISLDLLVEVHLTARVKGDVTIGLL
ncbi:hypothetical protein L198_03307 [Cryptococcus wingfieldii CBS 7118]|uniref:Uncharacterized protein n=1 Tax=Cryptococcus wingfieldii CBS 7118 TaxID=1295528 RepID=A0A1E3JF07_9TREE|nr:hypothetical protein L198_03307 [Cryptococcus wingfieldii CBS 7118]ODN99463.1 hypothetical protein L198_03307 [Cryptococcus wingfieldii CBS 7118]